MAELVDALDLGSSVLRAWEFESPSSYHSLQGFAGLRKPFFVAHNGLEFSLPL